MTQHNFRGVKCPHIWIKKDVEQITKGAYLASFSGSPLALYVKPVVVDGANHVELIVFTKDLERCSELSLDEFLVAKADLLRPWINGTCESVYCISEYKFLKRFRPSMRLEAVELLALNFDHL